MNVQQVETMSVDGWVLSLNLTLIPGYACLSLPNEVAEENWCRIETGATQAVCTVVTAPASSPNWSSTRAMTTIVCAPFLLEE